LLGCGNVGTFITRAVMQGQLEVEIGALYDADRRRAEALAGALGQPDLCKKTFEEFIAAPTDLIVEAASIEAVRAYAERILSAGKNLVVLSVGALLDEGFRRRLVSLAKANRLRIVVPSGAIGGLDLLKAAAVKGLDSVVLTTTKNPSSLEAGKITRKTIIFEGDAQEAVRLFPKNINVAAAVAIASGTNVKVRMVADPDARLNTHEVVARGAFGEMKIAVSNVPSPDNPKTSYLAALSVIRSIQGMGEALSLGA